MVIAAEGTHVGMSSFNHLNLVKLERWSSEQEWEEKITTLASWFWAPGGLIYSAHILYSL